MMPSQALVSVAAATLSRFDTQPMALLRLSCDTGNVPFSEKTTWSSAALKEEIKQHVTQVCIEQQKLIESYFNTSIQNFCSDIRKVALFVCLGSVLGRIGPCQHNQLNQKGTDMEKGFLCDTTMEVE